MKHVQWVRLAIIFRHLLEAKPLLTDVTEEGLSEEDIDHLTQINDLCKEGCQALSHFVVEGKVSLLRPYSIFNTSVE
jgi:hypothetical protein